MLDQESMLDVGWRETAACATDTEGLFFPAGDHEVAKIRAAKSLCDECPAQPDCLAYAIDTGQNEGIWGGLTAGERRSLVRQRMIGIRRAS